VKPNKVVKLELETTKALKADLEARRARWFIRGPLPLPWIAGAAKLPGKAMHVGLLLWFRCGCEKCRTVRLTRGHRELFGLGRHSVYRALKALEGAGLVQVQRHRGRCPVVTILETHD
jgi:hypothetical protein